MNLHVVTDTDGDSVRDEAEVAVIGSVFAEPACASEALTLVSEEDFSYREHRYIWRAVAWCVDNGVEPDARAVCQVLTQQHHLEAVGGADYLARIVEAIPTSANLPYWAKIVRERGARRRASAALESGAELAEVREILARAVTVGGRRFQLLPDHVVEAQDPPEWLIEGLIHVGGLFVLYGPSSSGKGFVALDWAYSIATNTPWHGRAVKPGPIVYIAAEGAPGLGPRIEAWKTANEWAGPADVQFLLDSVSMLTAAHVEEAIELMRALPVPPVLVIIDTVNQTIQPGDESKTVDMGVYVAACARIQRELGATVGVLHHNRRADDQERGSGALRNAADAMIKIERTGKVITLSNDKQRHAEEAPNIYLEMTSCMRSCVLVTPGGALELGAGHLLPNERLCLLALIDRFFDDGASATAWMAASGLAQSSFYLARKPLVGKGYVGKIGEGRGARYVPTDAGKEAVTPTLHEHSN